VVLAALLLGFAELLGLGDGDELVPSQQAAEDEAAFAVEDVLLVDVMIE